MSTLPGPGRRRGPSKGDRRERAILETARTLLARKPLADITIDELAAGADISRSSFYFYFDSKIAVVVALLHGLTGELGRDSGPWLEGSGPDEAALRRSLTALAVLWREQGRLIAGALAAAPGCPPLAEWRAGLRAAHVERLAARISRDRAAGLAPDGPAPRVLAGLVDDLRTAAFATAADPEALVDDLVTVELRMLYGDFRIPHPIR
ncbi:AcrR family transcriptional regulator [Actinoplanes campanulatus]|uniref:AcrR family transcriptional regulator n=1 Tax=Actinoplanes campanulatus TaxID=113559 RepID=A0A7W5FI83_9ACTN|nr:MULTISPECIES: TetR/AcrR family transcriptional regulator [Actinoplanes]MBB3099458.1 AcrR family transcriptional regulator [Actinoplanes campanulatus]GGN42765.1 TetR family transcriptional regulator [Actinoplanes campanulatus]GID39806.1 TetR family transcriptional regulator [Actinoplanes campanulatus]GID50228.1 TetR family transcriptional regulator [Actinoplanes capillaceus]